MDEQELKLFLEKNKKRFTASNAKSIFKNVLNKALQVDLKIFYDFLGEVLLKKSSLLEKSYIKLLKEYEEAISYIAVKIYKKSKKRIGNELLELEKYFLVKYCLYEEEEILLYFIGEVTFQKASNEISGRIFFTKFRIVVFGGPPGGGGTPFAPWAGLFTNLLMKSINKGISRSMGGKFKYSTKKVGEVAEPKDKIHFGYIFPISQPTDIELTRKKKGKHKGELDLVKFLSTVETKSFAISVSAHRDKKEEIYQKMVEILKDQQVSEPT